MMKRYATFLLLFGISQVYPADLVIAVANSQRFGVEIAGQGGAHALNVAHTLRNLPAGRHAARLFFPSNRGTLTYNVSINLENNAVNEYLVRMEDDDLMLDLVSITPLSAPAWEPNPRPGVVRPGPGNRPGNRPGFEPGPGNRPGFEPGPARRAPGGPAWVPVADERYFADLLFTVDRQFSDAGKMTIIRHAMNGMSFSTDHVLTLMTRLSFENNRRSLAIEAYPAVVDPERYFLVAQGLSFASNVRAVAEAVMSRGATGGYRGWGQPAHPADFQAAMNIINGQSFEQTRLVVARWIVMSLPLESRQVAAMMEAFSFEASRLELAKTAYPFVIDPQRYFVVFNAFQFESSARNFDQWMRSQRF